MESKPRSPNMTPIVFGADLRKGSSRPAADFMDTLSPHKLPGMRTMTRSRDSDDKERSARLYTRGLSVQQRLEYVDITLAKLRAKRADDISAITAHNSILGSERKRVLSGVDMFMPRTPTSQQSAHSLLPSHMHQSTSTSRSAFFEPCDSRSPGSVTINFDDQACSNCPSTSPLATPKSHPIQKLRQLLARCVNMSKLIRQVEGSKETMLDFPQGSAADIAMGKKESRRELRRGKVIRRRASSRVYHSVN